MLVGLIITLVGLVGALVSAPWGRHVAGLFKMVASTGFIGVAICACINAETFNPVYGGLILAGLFFSWWGDLFLVSVNKHIFLMGVGAFFLAHLTYAAAFIASGSTCCGPWAGSWC